MHALLEYESILFGSSIWVDDAVSIIITLHLFCELKDYAEEIEIWFSHEVHSFKYSTYIIIFNWNYIYYP